MLWEDKILLSVRCIGSKGEMEATLMNYYIVPLCLWFLTSIEADICSTWEEGIFNIYLGQKHICLCLDVHMSKGKLKQQA